MTGGDYNLINVKISNISLSLLTHVKYNNRNQARARPHGNVLTRLLHLLPTREAPLTKTV